MLLVVVCFGGALVADSSGAAAIVNKTVTTFNSLYQ